MQRNLRYRNIATVLMTAFLGALAGRPKPSPPKTTPSRKVPMRPHDAMASMIPLPADPDVSQPVATSQPTKHDPVWNGVLIGAGVGALLGLIPDHYDDCEECHDSLYGSIAVGAGIGLLIDLLRHPKRPSPAAVEDRVQLHLSLGQGGAVGLRGRIAWH